MLYVATWRKLHGVSVVAVLLCLVALSPILAGIFIGLRGRPMLPPILWLVGALIFPFGRLLFFM